MAENVQTSRGSLRRNQPDAGGANPQMVPLLGIVKDNIDPNRSGKIFVYLANNSGLDPENRANWRPVTFLSPFYGLTRGDAAKDDYGNYKNNPSSYGMWAAPPDIGTTVLCLFVNGDLNYGFYIGCVPDPEALQMVPAIGATDNIVPNKGEAQSYGGALKLPVTNINKNNKAIADTADFLTAAKPVHSYSSAVMFQQGILRDPVRGPISSSSQRETPSRVGWGVSTPGRPIYEGGFDDTTIAQNLNDSRNQQLRVVSRRGGHTIVMDDGDVIGRDNLVRIRTSLGHQILMSDDGQTLMILHSNGQSYIELGKEGTVDIYSTNSINLRTQGDLNLHADNNVNIHATKNLNIQGENIHINSEKEFKQRTGADHQVAVTGKHTTKVSGAMSMESKGDISMASTAQAYVNGSKVLLNSGQTSTKPQDVPAIEKVLHTDTLFDEEKGFLAAPAKLVSVTSRAPAHAPWSAAGQGVDIKTDLNASSQLPSSPSASVSSTNAVAASAGVSNPVSPSTIASVPNVPAASSMMDKAATTAVVGQIATDAATGALSAAVKQGSAIVETAQGAVTAVGQFAQTPQQLESAGILKKGSAALVESIAATTGNIQQAMPASLFTGKPGAESLGSLVQNVQAQAESVVTNLAKAQTSLQSTGVITGNESPTQVGGLIMSTAQNGLDSTLGAVKGSVSQLGGGISGALAAGAGDFTAGLSGKVDGVMKNISAGNFAAKLGESAGGALSGLQTSLDSMIQSPSLESVISQSAGISAGAFSAIKESMKPLQAGVPQNLSAIAKTQQSALAATSVSSATNIAKQASTSLLGQAKNGLAGVTDQLGAQVSGAAATALGASPTGLSKGSSIADSLISTAKSKTSTIATELVNVSDTVNLGGSLDLSSQAFTDTKSLLKNPSTSLDSLAGAASSAASGLVGSMSGSLASGLTKLPGGESAVSSITNLAKGALPNLPGTGDLKGALQGKASDLLNNITGGLSGKAGSLLNNAQNAVGGLASLIPKNLPSGAAAALQGALGSITAAGSGIKLPSIGLNTTDRSSITQAVTSQLDDPAIPVPRFGEVDETTKSQVEAKASERDDYQERSSESANNLQKAWKKRDKAQKALDKARKKLPQGDPAIAAAQQEYNAAYYEAEEAAKEFKEIREEGRTKGFVDYGPFG